ncbi:MAG: phosphopantetheine-binding protein [Oscillospiraceae bacterium]
MDKLMKILTENCPDIDFENEKRLLDDGILTSIDLVILVGELNDAYNIEISADDLMPEHFNSSEAILALIEGLLEK